MKFLNAEELTAGVITQLRAVECPTPEFGEGTGVYLAELDANERDELETLWAEKKAEYGEDNNIGFRAWVVAFCLCDETRQRLYRTPDDVRTASGVLGGRSAKAMSRLFNTAARINGLLRSDVETAEKNSVKANSAGGNGEQPSASDSQAGQPGSKGSRRKSTQNS